MLRLALRLAVFCAWVCCAPALAGEAPFDLIIANGHIIDGTGSPWYAADVGVRNGRIAAIGNLAKAQAKTAHRRRRQTSSRRASSTCWGNPNSPSWSTRACRPRFIRASPPKSPGRASRRPPMTGHARAEAGQKLEHYGAPGGLADAGRVTSPGWSAKASASIWPRTSVATTGREVVIGRGRSAAHACEPRAHASIGARAMEQGAVGVSTSLEYDPAPYAGTEETDRARFRSRPVRRHLRHAYALGGGRYGGRPRRDLPHCARGAYPVEIWHLESCRQEKLGPHA